MFEVSEREAKLRCGGHAYAYVCSAVYLWVVGPLTFTLAQQTGYRAMT